MPKATQTETRHGVELSSLDQPLFTGAEACKRDLIDYLEAASEPLLRELRDRPLTVLRVRPGQQPFMQKNLPDYAPDYVQWTPVWSESGHREIRYPLCNDLRTLLWLGNQRAVEFHPTLMVPHYGESTDVLGGTVTHLVLDLDPPEGSGFGVVVAVAHLVRQALADAGLAGAVKTSGSKGLHVIVPVHDLGLSDAAAATRALGIPGGPLLGLRLLNIAAACAAVALSYLLGRDLAGGDRTIGLVTAGRPSPPVPHRRREPARSAPRSWRAGRSRR